MTERAGQPGQIADAAVDHVRVEEGAEEGAERLRRANEQHAISVVDSRYACVSIAGIRRASRASRATEFARAVAVP